MHKASIILEFQSDSQAKAVLAAISPDNEPIPDGLKLDCTTENDKLRIVIECRKGVDTLGATIEDMMSAIDLTIRTSQCVSSSD